MNRGGRWAVYLGCAALAMLCYWSTAPRTITWWEGTSWVMAAATLGVTFPPGSLLLTILGWLVSKLPVGLPLPFQLNLFGGVLALGVLGFVYFIALDLSRSSSSSQPNESREPPLWGMLASGSALLTLALGWTMWRYANKFTPYILTALMTGVLLWAMLRWWRDADSSRAPRWLALVMLCFGLDFSIHRTNMLLLPGFALWILLRDPGVYRRLRNWAIACGSLVVGLSAQLAVMAIARRNPIVNANDPSTWSRFYDYVSLKQFGGGWLVDLWPRKGPFFSYQLMDYLKAFVATFADLQGPLGPIGVLPLTLGLVGIVSLWRTRVRLAMGMIVLYLLSSLGAVVYFNLPANFPWPMDRHYLASFVVFGIFVAIGAAAVMGWTWRTRPTLRKTALTALAALLVAMPASQWLRNHSRVDQSGDLFAYDYAGNILKTVGRDAIVIVQGDNLWPVWYRHAVEGMRPDVTILSLSLLNTGWYVNQMMNRPPGIPIELTDAEKAGLGPKEWDGDSIFVLPVTASAKNALAQSGIAAADSIHLHAPPPVYKNLLLPQEWLLLGMIQENDWKRPIYFTDVPNWLLPNCRSEGIVSHLLPTDAAGIDCALLHKNLITSYEYHTDGLSGAAGKDPLAWMSVSAAQRYIYAFKQLADCQDEKGLTEGAAEARARMQALFPSARSDAGPQPANR
jgi:hypothetical protein